MCITGSRAGNKWSALGQEAHRVISAYVEHLVTTRQSTDYEFFDSLLDGISLENIEGLDRVRETLVIEPEKVFGTEQYIALDEDFALLAMERVEGEHRSGGDPRIVYEGTLDMVLLHSPTEAEIPDWKNHFLIATPGYLPGQVLPASLVLRVAEHRDNSFPPRVFALGCKPSRHFYAQRSTALEANGQDGASKAA